MNKLYIGATLGVSLFVSGIMAGAMMVVAEERSPKEYATVTVPLELPDRVTSSIDVPEHNADLFVYTPTSVDVDGRDFVWEFDSLEKEVDCLAKNIYFEARNEPLRGQISVGLVTIQRVKDSAYPNTVCGVVWEKRKHPNTGKWVGQFSWTWDGQHDNPKNKKAWDESMKLAQAMLAGGSLDNFYDFLYGADHYHATYVAPYWRKHFEKVAQIGEHIFYRSEEKMTVANSL